MSLFIGGFGVAMAEASPRAATVTPTSYCDDYPPVFRVLASSTDPIALGRALDTWIGWMEAAFPQVPPANQPAFRKYINHIRDLRGALTPASIEEIHEIAKPILASVIARCS
ncbi:hypothetical protein [Amycolatopsis circi]|uniref:hypothetical protein n=1 Tax=Amycolatopsis circi TaxID=871959 RepID=UPI0013BEA585|nr:hypothetical protein [Amycolatopsis circi]